MRIIASTILLLTACLALADKPEDASDLFLRAFREFQKGEKFVAQNAVAEATQAFKQSEEVLKELETKYPDWNKAVVKYRKDRVAAALEKLQAQPGTPATSEAPRVPPETHRSPDINQMLSNKPSTEQWQQFHFNGQPFYFVPLMVPPDQYLGAK